MIPFRHVDERVFAAVWKIDDLQHRTENYEVRVDVWTFAHLRFYWPPALESMPHGGFRLFGMPVVGDPTLRRGEIVVRHEVEA